MNRSRWPITGYYFSNQYVIVYGENQRDELESLGHFGRNLKDIERKEDSRRGLEDSRILSLFQDKDDEYKVILSLHDAFFLTYALGCLDIRLDKENRLDVDTCWCEFRRYYSTSNLKIDFSVEFGVYYYFRTRGWVVKSGNNYGTNFLLYKDSPSTTHSIYAIYIVPPGNNNPNWKTVLTYQRVIQSVNKELLIVHVDHPDNIYDRPSCITNMRMRIRKVACKTNLML
jgi:tRNA-intron lyase